jgi:hypothetical protein
MENLEGKLENLMHKQELNDLKILDLKKSIQIDTE